jgi:hypothetical protein
MKMPKGSKTRNRHKLAHREALECLGDKKLGLAAQLADSGWSDFFEKLDAIEWYVKKWKINVSQHALEKLQIGAAIKESKLNKVWIARRQKCKKRKCKRRTRRPLTLKRK